MRILIVVLFAGPVWSKKAEELPGMDVKGRAIYSFDATLVHLGQVIDGDGGHITQDDLRIGHLFGG